MTSAAIYFSGVLSGVIWTVLLVGVGIWFILAGRHREPDREDRLNSRPTPSGTVIAFRRK